MNPIVKILIGIVAFLLLLLIILTFASGSIIKSFINGNGPSMIGRQMHVEDASLNFVTGKMQLDSLVIYEADGSTTFASVHQLSTKVSIPKLFSGTYDLSNMTIDQLRLNIQQQDTVFNFSDIIEFLGEDDGDPLPLILRNVDIRNSYIHYQDLLVGSDFRINDFSLFIPGVDLRDVNTSVGVQLSFMDGGNLNTKFDYDNRHQSYSLDLKLNDFNLTEILPYVRQQILFGELQGTMNLELEVKGSLKHMLDLTLHGRAGIRNLLVQDPDGNTMVQCDTVAIGVRDLDLPQNRIELSSIHFLKPTFHIAYGKDSLDNFTRLMVIAEERAEEELKEGQEMSDASVTFNGKEKELRLVVDRLSIEDGYVSYRDESLQADPFVYELSKVNFSAPNFTLNGNNHISISAKLGNEGRLIFRYDGKITDQRNMHMTLNADDIEFSDFSPYTVQMFGNEVTNGKLSINMLAQTTDGELFSQNRITLVDPKIEKKRRGVTPEMNIPFRAGMYILTDKNNICDLDLPVKGNINEPKFSYKRLIFRTLGKLIVKVSTSPFRRHKDSSGANLSSEEILQLDDRSLDDINIEDVSEDMLQDE